MNLRDPAVAVSWRRVSAAIVRIASVTGCAALAGCYALVPAAIETIAPPARVRLALTPAGAAHVAEVIGDQRDTLEGRLVGRDDAVLRMLIPTALPTPAGTAADALHQQLLVPRTAVLAVWERRFDRRRTATVAAAGGLVAALLVRRWFAGDRGGSTTIPPVGGSESRSMLP